MEKRRRRKFPLSGDHLVDVFFRTLIDVLDGDLEAIYMKKDLRDPDNRKRRLFGILMRDEKRIYLGKSKHKKYNEPLVKSLIHELLHQIFPHTMHKRIRLFEAMLWIRFTDSQKRFLRKYIPKHTVKKEP